MKKSKTSMLLYFDEMSLLSDLNGDDYKTILEGIIRYGQTGELTKMPEKLELIYQVMIRHIERDTEKYEARMAGRKSRAASGDSKC